MSAAADTVARYTPRGVAAIDPQALGADFPICPPRANRDYGGVTVVSIAGPLLHGPLGPFDTYEQIGARAMIRRWPHRHRLSSSRFRHRAVTWRGVLISLGR